MKAVCSTSKSVLTDRSTRHHIRESLWRNIGLTICCSWIESSNLGGFGNPPVYKRSYCIQVKEIFAGYFTKVAVTMKWQFFSVCCITKQFTLIVDALTTEFDVPKLWKQTQVSPYTSVLHAVLKRARTDCHLQNFVWSRSRVFYLLMILRLIHLCPVPGTASLVQDPRLGLSYGSSFIRPIIPRVEDQL